MGGRRLLLRFILLYLVTRCHWLNLFFGVGGGGVGGADVIYFCCLSPEVYIKRSLAVAWSVHRSYL